jgi:predicted DsbA family dithiol-disulfide isomerase
LAVDPVRVDYFSDLLCVWAYVAEARVREMCERFAGHVAVVERHCPVFGDTATRIGKGWADRGGYAGFGAHVREVVDGFGHVSVHPELWHDVRPTTSSQAHLTLKAAQLVEQRLGLAPGQRDGLVRLPSAHLAWAIRLAFFRDAQDISHRDVLVALAEGEGLPLSDIEQEIVTGRALAGLAEDAAARERLGVAGSPTFILNEGRQKLYGNVGYRVIEANIQELLREPSAGQASWC